MKRLYLIYGWCALFVGMPLCASEGETKKSAETAYSKKELNAQFLKAAQKSDVEQMALWLSRGANVSAPAVIKEKDGRVFKKASALYYAEKHCNVAMLRMLKRNGIDINEGVVYEDVGRSITTTMLHLTALHSNHPFLVALIACGADPRMLDKQGTNVLHLAAASASINCVAAALACGIKVDDGGYRGLTPLMLAATEMAHTQASSTSGEKVISLLRCCGANVGAKTAKGLPVQGLIDQELSKMAQNMRALSLQGIMRDFTVALEAQIIELGKSQQILEKNKVALQRDLTDEDRKECAHYIERATHALREAQFRASGDVFTTLRNREMGQFGRRQVKKFMLQQPAQEQSAGSAGSAGLGLVGTAGDKH